VKVIFEKYRLKFGQKMGFASNLREIKVILGKNNQKKGCKVVDSIYNLVLFSFWAGICRKWKVLIWKNC
jgi:hypothetical protein